MKRFLLYIALIIPLRSAAQFSLSTDTIEIPGVVIRSIATDNFLSAYKIIKTDSALLKSYDYGSVADVIALSSPLFIKTYGTGGIATPSFRGTGASNTLVTWNGIRIDHPMLGQTDLSMLPAGFTDELNIYAGGASMPLYSGAPGGLISIETRPVWEKMTSVSVSPGAGSFGKYSGSVIVRTGSGRFHSSTKAFSQRAENNFPFINTVSGPEPVREIRKNSEIRQEGFIQELYFRGESAVFSAHFWYQDADRNLPAPVIAQTPGQVEKQNDESIKALVNYDLGINKSKLSLSGAWIMNRLDYYNKFASINSKNRSDMLVFKADLNHAVGDKFKLGIGFNEELTSVRSNNYESGAGRNSADIAVMISDNGSSRLGGSLLFREILHDNKFLKPDFSSGLKYKISATKDYILSANFSRTSRIPSMNDMYWYPGGNRELRNENALVYELNYRMKERISSSVAFSYSLSAYRNAIHDMIQWRPGEYSYWTAVNIREVRTAGLETSVSASYKKDKILAALNAGYSFTKAYDDEPGSERRQLMYVPRHLSNAAFTFSYGRFHSGWNMSLNGKRFVSTDNSRTLPPYAVHRISTGFRLEPSWGIMDLGIDIENLFNSIYETVAYYPLPGRSYFFKILIQIKSEK